MGRISNVLNFLKVKLKFLIVVKNSDPLYTKTSSPILLLLRQTGCVCANRQLFKEAISKKYGNYTFYVWRVVWRPWKILSSNKNVPSNRKK
jgi:hypothetical protein